MAQKKGLLRKEIRRVIDKIEPDLKELLRLLAQADDEEDESVVEEIIENGARNLLIAKKIVKERLK